MARQSIHLVVHYVPEMLVNSAWYNEEQAYAEAQRLKSQYPDSIARVLSLEIEDALVLEEAEGCKS